MKIHKTAIVSEKAILGDDVEIGPFSIIYDNVEIKSGVKIEGYCEIGVENSFSAGEPIVIGMNSHIRSHSIFYTGSKFGDNLITGHRVTVREKTIAGIGLQIGTLSDIQGHCVIGNYVRFHSNVHIGQKSRIGNYVWIFPYVVLTNDPHPPSNVLKGVVVEDFAVIATMSVILRGVKVAAHSLVGAHSLVVKDTEPHKVYAGSPAKYICQTDKIKHQDGSGESAYPWNKKFIRGYPDSIVQSWSDS